MKSEKAVDAFLEKHEQDEWLDHSDGYQMLFESCGEELLPGLLRLTKHSVPGVRAAVVSLLATRRPHTPEMIEAIAPLLFDPDPMVQVRVLNHLPDFGEMAAPLAVDAYILITADKHNEDQLPRALAIQFLLSLHPSKYDHLLFDLHDIVERDKGDMAETVALSFLTDYYKILDPDRKEDGHGECELNP
jgi:HEAT repeat protein